MTRYVVPKIKADPAAAYRLADAYLDLADAVVAAQQRSTHIVGDLAGGWHGRGRRGFDVPAELLARNALALARMLRDTSAELDAYGRHLETAHHHHGFSLHKLLVVGAIVAVSAAAIIVTVGAASVVEAAAAAAAVGTATEAAGAATAADLAAASEIDAAVGGIESLRPLLTFVVPHLLPVEWAAGGRSVYDELTLGHLRWGDIAETGAMAFVAGGGATKATSMAADSRWLTEAPARVGAAVPIVIEGTSWAGFTAGEDGLVEHRFDPLDISESFVLGGASPLAKDVLRDRGLWPAEQDYRRAALVNLTHQNGRILDPGIARELSALRQPALEIQRGEVDLRVNEGPGHTIARHIGKSPGELLHRVRTTRISVASTYWDKASADDATRLTLSANKGLVERWIAAGSPKSLRLRLTMPYNVGFAVTADNRVTFVRETVVVLRHDRVGIVVVTSYPRGVSR